MMSKASLILEYQGLSFYMGDNKGLKHSWTDTDVMNGQTYYYAVVSYDRGDASIGLYPSECTKVIVRDAAGNITLDVNTAQITPGTGVAGYVAPEVVDTVFHSDGNATGLVYTEIVDPNLVEDKEYTVSFENSTSDTTLYSLYEVNGNDLKPLIENSPYIDGEDFNDLVDGLRLFVDNDVIEFDPDNSGWSQDNCNLIIQGEKLLDVPDSTEGYPVSYEIRVGEPDSSWLFRYRAPTNFQVWDVYNNQRVLFYHWEPNDQVDNTLNAGDYIEIWKELEGTMQRIWRFSFIATPNEEVVNPVSGTTGRIKIKTPFKSNDKYSFTTVKQYADNSLASENLDNVAVVPNPYVGAARWEPQRLTTSGRGERRIFFINLPQKAFIRIYTISGDHVVTLEHDSGLLNGKESWDLKSKSGLDIAPGIYIYHLDAPGIGEKIGRFAIIK